MGYLLSEDQAIYVNFLDWMYKTSRPKIHQSYDEYWQCLVQYFGLFARRRVNGEVHEQMQQVRWPSCLYQCRTNINNSFLNVYSLLSARSSGVQRRRTHWMWMSSASSTAITGSIQDISITGACSFNLQQSSFGPPSPALDQACYFCRKHQWTGRPLANASRPKLSRVASPNMFH